MFRSIAADLPRIDEIRLDWRIVLYALLCSIVATLLCGLIPAVRGTRRHLSASLAQASRTQVSGRNRLQWVLVGTQVALAVALLVGAGLLVRSFRALGRVSPGFEPSRILTFRISGSYGETGDWRKLSNRIEETVNELGKLPGIEAAATTGDDLPGVPQLFPTELKFVEGEQDTNHKMVVESRFVSPSYLATMQIPLLAGELCRDPVLRPQSTPEDPSASTHVEATRIEVMVNRSFANAFSSGSSAVGRHLSVLGLVFLKPEQAGEIRGIVGDAREEGMNRPPSPTVYWCMTASGPDPFYLVRTRAAEPLAMAATVRKKIKEIEPARSVFDITPLEDRIDNAFAENRLRTVLLTFFAATAISLACVGLYGTLSYSVNVRQHEVGLRLALGALRGQIVSQFLRQGLIVSAVGCVVGWGISAASNRVLAEMLYGVSPSDVITVSGVIVLVLFVATIASMIPAIRAARLDPMQVLRDE